MKVVISKVHYPNLESLPLRDILALALREGLRGDGDRVVDSLMASFPSLRELFDASLEELDSVRGIGLARAMRIKATIELARRYVTLPPESRVTVSSPADVAALLGPEMRHLQQEVFKVLLLSSKNQVLQVVTVSVGTLNTCLVHPRELFRQAVKRSSAAMIAVHNHPSGIPTPSQEDIALTKRLREAGKVLGIEVLDHVVVAQGGYCSFREQGLL